ncbi:DUF3703 domain-containing protein [Pseudoalteromonas shioyasakiensis]|uniref:DUF3703 domain-containing protein n=1 Tax=Pseudoalteromonas shioyasakiensis TaxID=1190813 RepID=UPI0022B1CEB6|nr:DUF3703 domain-containing protein [Pseudoalteromonas shioyasakiensis]MCZ4252986.1 DUF3703 domain-containing protein [Pseudoalteromonas shioyasakiensis]
MNIELKNAFNTEMILAKTSYKKADYTTAFYHLERAHILGQSYIIAHTYSHWWMCKIGFKTHNAKEIIGQFARMAASIVFSRIWVPLGNTGGTNVSPFKPMPITDDLKRFLS